MAETSHPAPSDGEGLLVLGRHGRADGAAGVIMRERRGPAFAILRARAGKHAHLSDSIQATFGIGLPAVDDPGVKISAFGSFGRGGPAGQLQGFAFECGI